MKKIKGKFLQVRANGHTIALSTNCSLQTTTQYSNDEKTKDEEKGPDPGDPEYVDWTINVDALMGASEQSQLTYSQLIDLQLSLVKFDVEFFLVANGEGAVPDGDWTPEKAEAVGMARYGGKAIIESVNASGPAEGKASFNVSLKAAGVLKKITE